MPHPKDSTSCVMSEHSTTQLLLSVSLNVLMAPEIRPKGAQLNQDRHLALLLVC